MTINTDRRAYSRRVRRSGLAAVVVLIGSLAVGGCSPVLPKRDGGDQVAHPMTDEQTRSQVVEPASEIAQIAHLPYVYGSFDFGRCAEGGPPFPPPYRGVVDMNFTLPAGHQANAYLDQVAATMVAHGWTDGPSPGLNPVGRAIHEGGVTAAMTADQQTGFGRVQLLGECRNLTGNGKYGITNGQDVTDELRQR
jgi:hypothetical protein